MKPKTMGMMSAAVRYFFRFINVIIVITDIAITETNGLARIDDPSITSPVILARRSREEVSIRS